jgi:hypothetical protein
VTRSAAPHLLNAMLWGRPVADRPGKLTPPMVGVVQTCRRPRARRALGSLSCPAPGLRRPRLSACKHGEKRAMGRGSGQSTNLRLSCRTWTKGFGPWGPKLVYQGDPGERVRP